MRNDGELDTPCSRKGCYSPSTIIVNGEHYCAYHWKVLCETPTYDDRLPIPDEKRPTAEPETPLPLSVSDTVREECLRELEEGHKNHWRIRKKTTS